jgi:hypothetical protein
MTHEIIIFLSMLGNIKIKKRQRYVVVANRFIQFIFYFTFRFGIKRMLFYARYLPYRDSFIVIQPTFIFNFNNSYTHKKCSSLRHANTDFAMPGLDATVK